MHDEPLSRKERRTISAVLAATVLATVAIMSTAAIAYVWYEVKEMTIAEARKPVLVTNRPQGDLTSHERLKSLREPISGWTAEHRVLERRGLAILRQLEADYRQR